MAAAPQRHEPEEHRMQRAAWIHTARWGAFIHFLADTASSRGPSETSVDAWNAAVDRVDPERTVAHLAEAGAGWLFLTLGQNAGFYCSPNATYDRLVGRAPSRCSRRDLLGEFARAASAAGLRMGAYLPSHAPAHDRQAVERLRCTPPWSPHLWSFASDAYAADAVADERLSVFQGHWEAIIGEWSQRWGTQVAAWWLDGCYHAEQMYRHAEAPNLDSFAAALRRGNPDAALAFNGGLNAPWQPLGPAADFTPGECGDLRVADGRGPLQREMHGTQLHVLTYLGRWWGAGEPRLAPDLVRAYTRHVNACGGGVSWDLPMLPEGGIPDAHRRALAAIGA
jgi:hypothetical protein